jgi:hypothetical protein
MAPIPPYRSPLLDLLTAQSRSPAPTILGGFSSLQTLAGGAAPTLLGGSLTLPGGLTAFLYQRDGEFIAFARPDLAVSGMGSLSAVQAVDIRALSVV